MQSVILFINNFVYISSLVKGLTTLIANRNVMYSNLTQRAKRTTSVVKGAFMTIWNDSIRTVVLTFIFEVDSYLSAIMEVVNK